MKKRSDNLLLDYIPGCRRGSVWLPTYISGCKLWLSSDYAYQDAAKAVPCVNDSLIYTGEDKSGNGHDVVQTTEAKRFIYKTNQLDGYPGWRTDGIDDEMNAAFTLIQPFSTYVVFKIITHFHTGTLLDGYSYNGGRFCCYNLGSGELYYSFTGAFLPVAAEGFVLSLNTPYLFEIISNGIVSEIARNGETPIVGNAGTNNPDGITIGALGEGTGQRINADLFEVIRYNAVLSAAERTQIKNYFHTKYPSLW
jgi:hypothetical protein